MIECTFWRESLQSAARSRFMRECKPNPATWLATFKASWPFKKYPRDRTASIVGRCHWGPSFGRIAHFNSNCLTRMRIRPGWGRLAAATPRRSEVPYMSHVVITKFRIFRVERYTHHNFFTGWPELQFHSSAQNRYSSRFFWCVGGSYGSLERKKNALSDSVEQFFLGVEKKSHSILRGRPIFGKIFFSPFSPN